MDSDWHSGAAERENARRLNIRIARESGKMFFLSVNLRTNRLMRPILHLPEEGTGCDLSLLVAMQSISLLTPSFID